MVAKGLLRLPNLLGLIKQRVCDFTEIWLCGLNRLFNDPGVLSSAPDKAKLIAENFSRNSNLNHSGISLLAFPSSTSQKLHNISVTPKLAKKAITNLDS